MISALRHTVTKKKNRTKKLDLLVKNYEKRLSLSEVGMTTTINSLTELKTRISQISNNKKSLFMILNLLQDLMSVQIRLENQSMMQFMNCRIW